MDDHNHGLALQYGNPGPASYSSATQSWHFTRRFRPSHTISYTGVSSLVIPPSLSDSPALEKDKKDEQELLREYPQFIGSTSSYARDEEKSRFISQANSYFDPRISTLIEFGTARLSKTHRWTSRLHTVPIVALASGHHGNILSFCAVDDELIKRGQVNELAFRVPTINTLNSVNWPCGEEPIRQIKFADTFEKSECLFAVRLGSHTSIFRPIYYEESMLIDPPQNTDERHSKIQLAHIDPNPIVKIDLCQTGGYAHVDVAFNPWYQKQFAIIDERGHWTIWLINDLVQHSNNIIPERLHSGSLLDLNTGHDERRDETDHIQYDGWGKCQWIGDIYTFIVCNRRTAVLYVTEEATPVSYDIRLNCQSSNEWILDMKTSLLHPSHVFILTTLRILCFNVTSREPGSQFLLPQFSWQHGRDADDITLRLTSLSLGQEYCLLLYSRLDACLLAFQIQILDSGNSSIAMSDPYYVSVPGIADFNGLDTIRYKSPIRQVIFKELEQTPARARTSFTPNLRLMKLFVLDSTLAVQEYIFSKPYDPYTEGEMVLSREVLSFGKALDIFRKRQQEAATRITIDGPMNSSHANREVQDKAGVNSRRMIDFTRTYALLCTDNTRYTKRSRAVTREYQSFKHWVENLVVALSNFTESEPAFVQTMLDIIQTPPASSDIDEILQEIEFLKSRFSPANRSADSALCFLPLDVTSCHLQEEIEDIRSLKPFDLLQLYNSLVGDWLSPLPRKIPSWTRIYKEKMIRQVFTDVCLASMIQLEAPVSDSTTLISSQVSSPQYKNLERDQADASDRIMTDEDDRQKSSDIVGLKTLSPQTMDNPAAGAVQDVLSHWNLGGNPDLFDWEMVFMTDSRQRDSRSQSKERARTRTRSHSRAASEGLRALRSSPVVPSVQYPGSQPQQSLLKQLQSSQISEDVPQPMSQVERGLFGGRDAGKKSKVKARKKKRAAGF